MSGLRKKIRLFERSELRILVSRSFFKYFGGLWPRPFDTFGAMPKAYLCI